ncbi:hypothetical protein PTSG_03452 [Salpingoeca rosetta]|uniref:Pre-mRNA-processing factor 19 n=1 Tax=Salpingoeca rosetta (strain ATCC 50818 / BSB-021) TaxID=946362 RepID=F2U586_SALR5|nr:uncharacterized protein PTSG_03452 [Salpingoeca rosetta]EGD82802.1 hypothetical protein PTSG_03452 [Salpingoeca rosetta]|eukprot:XP_004996037.1 hypothetical protein PTSG_03452 [Salpingoeca rosetta]
MSLNCAISGAVPEHPVVSPKSGAVFERRVIEKHLRDNQTDPVSGDPLEVDELIDVKGGDVVQPRAPNATSIPSLLKTFQDEWDAVMLESFELKKHVMELRQELTHSLYQHDASCRLIARLTRERDQARQALVALEQQAPQMAQQAAAPAEAPAAAEEQEGPLPAEVVASIKATHKKLSKQRKKRFKAADFPAEENVNKYTCQKTHSGMHSSRSKAINDLAVHPTQPNIVLTAGQDKTALVYDLNSEEILTTYKGHSKKVTACLLHPTQDVAITASADNTVHIWTTAGDTRHIIKAHKATVEALSLHPTMDYVLAADAKGVWSFTDVLTGETLSTHKDEEAASGITCAQWHPDGTLFAVGTKKNTVRVWNINQHQMLQSFEGHAAPITAIAFSESGLHLASASSDGVVKLWNLRTLECLNTLELDAGTKVNALCFDDTGRFLAIGGSDLRIVNVSKWETVATHQDHSSNINALAWTAGDPGTLLSAGADNAICVYTV